MLVEAWNSLESCGEFPDDVINAFVATDLEMSKMVRDLFGWMPGGANL